MLGKGFAWHIALPEEANRDTDVLANRRFRRPRKKQLSRPVPHVTKSEVTVRLGKQLSQ